MNRLALILALVACGKSSDPPSSKASGAPAPSKTRTLHGKPNEAAKQVTAVALGDALIADKAKFDDTYTGKHVTVTGAIALSGMGPAPHTFAIKPGKAIIECQAGGNVADSDELRIALQANTPKHVDVVVTGRVQAGLPNDATAGGPLVIIEQCGVVSLTPP